MEELPQIKEFSQNYKLHFSPLFSHLGLYPISSLPSLGKVLRKGRNAEPAGDSIIGLEHYQF
jgi:hypothetical protein